MKGDKKSSESIVINEVQLLLAEKRTSLSVMRTGIAVLVLPLSVLSLLIATSKYYDIFHVMNMFIPLMVINAILILLGSFLIVRSFLKMRHYDSLIQKLKKKHSAVSEFIDWSCIFSVKVEDLFFGGLLFSFDDIWNYLQLGSDFDHGQKSKVLTSRNSWDNLKKSVLKDNTTFDSWR